MSELLTQYVDLKTVVGERDRWEALMVVGET